MPWLRRRLTSRLNWTEGPDCEVLALTIWSSARPAQPVPRVTGNEAIPLTKLEFVRTTHVNLMQSRNIVSATSVRAGGKPRERCLP